MVDVVKHAGTLASLWRHAGWLLHFAPGSRHRHGMPVFHVQRQDTTTRSAQYAVSAVRYSAYSLTDAVPLNCRSSWCNVPGEPAQAHRSGTLGRDRRAVDGRKLQINMAYMGRVCTAGCRLRTHHALAHGGATAAGVGGRCEAACMDGNVRVEKRRIVLERVSSVLRERDCGPETAAPRGCCKTRHPHCRLKQTRATAKRRANGDLHTYIDSNRSKRAIEEGTWHGTGLEGVVLHKTQLSAS